MPKAVQILFRILLSILLVFFTFVVAVGAAFQIDQVFCGDSNGTLAAGGGAALGMFVLFYIGFPTIVYCVVSEVISNFWLLPLHYRLMLLALPVLAASLFMGWFSRNLCLA